MSYGLMCLICRHYISTGQSGTVQVCQCDSPLPSEDGKTIIGLTAEEFSAMIDQGAIIQIGGQYYRAERM